MTRSFGGRSRVYRPRTGTLAPRRGAATTVPQSCLSESFDQADSETIGPDLDWLSAGALTFDQMFVPLSGSIPTTITESFNTSNGTTIGPDLTWGKTSFASGGTGGGVIDGNTFAVVGNPDADKFAQCKILTTPTLPGGGSGFNGAGTTIVEATLTMRSTNGVGAGQVDYTRPSLHFGRVKFEVDSVQGARIVETGGTNSAFNAAATPTAGDVLSLEVSGPASSVVAVGKINGSTVVTHPLFLAPLVTGNVGLELEVSCVSQASFTADAQDKLDAFEASGEITASGFGVAYTVDDLGTGDMTITATVPEFDDSSPGVQLQLYARISGTDGPTGPDDFYVARFQSNTGTSFVDVATDVYGGITDQETITPDLAAGDELEFTITGTTTDLRLVCKVNGVTMLDWDATAIGTWTGLDPVADFDNEFPNDGRRAGLGVSWQGTQNANALDDWQACPA